MKLWGARFSKEIDRKVNDFNSSIRFDSRMYEQDIRGSMAHAAMLGACNIIGEEESEKIIEALGGILRDIEDGKLEFPEDAEDIHMSVEEELTRRIGDTGKRLHTARSRNDQVALDIRMYLKDEEQELEALCRNLIETICQLASWHLDTIMPGYTHLQRAQPITFAHHLLAYAQMLRRDIGRLQDCRRRMDQLPLGSGALASTTYPIDRFLVAEKLDFSGVTANSLDGVSDRDFVIELSSALSIIMMHLSRFSEEMILWCSHEFAFIELDDAYSTGSSIMPQKKNPDIAELVRGKTGRVYGDLMAILTVMKGLPLAYNKDMQEDKECVFDAVDTVKLCLDVFADMLKTCKVNAANMRKAASAGFINATDCADYLVKKGMPFRDAYKIVGSLVAYCISHHTDLESLSLEEYQAISPVFGEDVYPAIALETCVAGRKVYGGPARAAVETQLRELADYLEEQEGERV